MRKFWNEKLDNILRRNYASGDLDALAARLGVTRTAIKSRAKVLGLKRKVNAHHPWTERQTNTLRRYYATMPMEWLVVHTNHCADSIYNKAHSMGLVKPREYLIEMGRKNAQHPASVATRFKKGTVPFNKGKRQEEYMSAEGIESSKHTRFKNGHRPHNTRPVGYERIDDDGYILVKIADGQKMVHKHRYVWQQHHGDVPEKHVIRFRDGDRTNCDISNLELVSMADNQRRNIQSETAEQRKNRIEKATAKRNHTIRMDKIRLHWGIEPKTKLVKRW